MINVYKPKTAEGVSIEDSNILNKPFILESFTENKFDMGDKTGIVGALMSIRGSNDKIRVSGQVLIKQLGEMREVGLPIATKIVQIKGQKFKYFKFAQLTPEEIATITAKA